MDPKLSTNPAIGEAEDCPAGPRAPASEVLSSEALPASPEAGPMREQPATLEDGQMDGVLYIGSVTGTTQVFHLKEKGEVVVTRGNSTEIQAELASLRLAVERLTETNQRLHRRCQVAEKAVQTKCEDFNKRSTKGLRNFYYQRNKELEAEVLRLTQENDYEKELLADAGRDYHREVARADQAEAALLVCQQAIANFVEHVHDEECSATGCRWYRELAALLPSGCPTQET